MEVAMESMEDDDEFFADLNKQISLLIMDDDDDDPVIHCPSSSLETLSRAIHPAAAESPYGYNHLRNWRRESKGTGVFIPQSLMNSRRKNNRQGRSFISSSNTKVHSQRHSHHNSRDHQLPPASSHFLKNSVSGSMDRLILETNPTFS